MNRNVFICSAIVMLLAAPAAFSDGPPPSVTFAASSVNELDTWTDNSSYTTTATLTRNDGYRDLAPTTQSTSVVRTKTLKVLSAHGNDRITGVEVQYSFVELNGTDVTPTFAGKAYRFTVQGNKVDPVTYADGSSVPAAEAAFVASDNTRLGQIRAMNKTFGGKTVSVGEILRSNNEEDLIDADAGLTVRDFSMTLAAISGDGAAQTATFNVTLKLANSVKKGKGKAPTEPAPFDTSSVEIDLSGTLTARVSTSRITNISLAGPSTIGGSKKSGGKKGQRGQPLEDRFVTLSGTGQATLSTSYTYP